MGALEPDAVAAERQAEWRSFEHVFPRTRMVAGLGSADRLPEAIAERGGRRALIVCGRTVAEGPQLRLIEEIAGDLIVGVFGKVRPQGGLSGALDGVRAVEETGADCLISVGGGSAIDSAKCIALLRACGDAPLEQFRVQDSIPASPVPPTMLHVAVPTTAGSSSEVMPWAGVRDELSRQKMLFRDTQLIPEIAILDPRLVQHTSPWLTATSGVTSLARSIETLYSRARQPIAEALALSSLRLMLRSLPTAVQRGDDLIARAETQTAASLSGIAAENSMVSLVHAIGHSVGGRLALQHGVSHAILLPPVAALYFPTLGSDLLAQVCAAFGVGVAGLDDVERARACVQALREVLAGLPLATRLREVGVPADAIDDLAEQTVHDHMFGFVPLATSKEQVRELLAACW
jgi:alcohol dehydrogenase class IV